MQKMIQRLKEDDGFTLLEMAIVVLVITALLLLVITNVGGVKDSVDKSTGQGVVTTVETQKVLYEMDKNVELSGDDAAMLDELLSNNYITKSQKEAYLKASQGGG